MEMPAAMAVHDDADRLSELPDDLLLMIMEMLVMDGDAHTVATTPTLSRRWRRLPWHQITNVSLDAASFTSPVNLTAALSRFLTALSRFLAARPSERAIETLRLKLDLTIGNDQTNRVGALVGRAIDAGTVRRLELEFVAEELLDDRGNLWNNTYAMQPYGHRFMQFHRSCGAGAFRTSLTSLTMTNLWFGDADTLNDVVRGCAALESLDMRSCGFGDRVSALVIDATPESRLETLLCDGCFFGCIKLVYAPKLRDFYCNWPCLRDDSAPVSFGCTPSLRKLHLKHGLYDRELSNKCELSNLLTGAEKIEKLKLSFQLAPEVWVDREAPEQLGAVLGRVKTLRLDDLPPGFNDLSWALFLLEAAPLLETFTIAVNNHECWQKYCKSYRRATSETATAEWQPSSPGFEHQHLRKVAIRRTFHLHKDVPFARMIMEMAVNLEVLTMGVESLECEKCEEAELISPDLAKSRFRFPGSEKRVCKLVKKIKRGIPTFARIDIL